MNFFITNYFTVLTSILFFGLVGEFFSKIFKVSIKNKDLSFFSNITFGLVFTLSFFAMYKTSFNTIFSIIFISFLFLLFQLKKRNNGDFNFKFNLTDKKVIANVAIFTFISLVLQYIIHVDFQSLKIGIPFDTIYYSDISYYHSMGFENKVVSLNELLENKKSAPAPYHYVDSWLNCFINIYSTIGYTKNFIFITYPILITTTLLGIRIIVKRFIQNPFLVFLFSLSSIVFSPLVFDFLITFINNFIFSKTGLFHAENVFENIGFYFNTNMFSYYGQKHLPIFILSVLFVNLYLEFKSWSINLLLLALFSTFHIGTLPVIIFSFFGFYIFDIQSNKALISNSKKYIFPVLVCFFVFTFYYVINNESILRNYQSNFFYKGNHNLNFKGEIIRILNRTGYFFVFFVFTYSPTFLLFSIKKFRTFILSKHKNLFVFLAIMCFVFTITRIFFVGFDSAQFITSIYPLINILFFTLTIVSFSFDSSRFKLRNLIVIVLVATSFFTYTISTRLERKHVNCKEVFKNCEDLKVYDKEYTENILKELNYNKKTIIGYLISSSSAKEYSGSYLFPSIPNYFLMQNGFFRQISLTEPNILKSGDFSNHMYFLNETSEDIIIQNKIKFISCSANVEIPSYIQKKLKSIYVNSFTNESFLILN